MTRASTWLPVAGGVSDSAVRNNMRRFYLGWERNIALMEDLDWLAQAGESTDRVAQRLGFRSWQALWDHLHSVPVDGNHVELGAEAARLKRLLARRRRHEDEALAPWRRRPVRSGAL